MSDAGSLPAPVRRLWTPRLVAALALFVVAAAVFCAAAGYALVRQADERQGLERRSALMAAIEDVREAGADIRALDAPHLLFIERSAGVKSLRFETEPTEDDREIQSVLDGNGRIVGWFSWEPEHSMSRALGQLRPLLAVTGIVLIGFAVMAFWQVRRALHDLAESERRAWTLAHEDLLTGLPNRRKTRERIDAALEARAHGEVVTLACLDLDGLKDINDAHGHRAGDGFLKAVADRLREHLPPRAFCGRFDGDEFTVAVVASDMEQAEAFVRTLAAELARPYWIDDRVISAGVTAGLAHAPRDAQTRDELMRRADLALRAAKRDQRGGVVAFKPAMDAEFDDRRFLERELRRAIDEKALDVHYQPIVSAGGNRIVGTEALLRWTHPVRGAISPSQFVTVAEQAGLMGKLGDFVLRRALADARRWPDIYVAVNLSPLQVRDPVLVETIAALLAEYGLPPARLMLEVTEGVLIDKPDEAKARLDALRALGVRLALDDFGTGYSSLSYLQRFKFDKLKIDRGFVAPLGESAGSQAMMQAIVSLGRALGLTLLAEGVETEEQRVLLRMAGCDEMQGYLFARPAPREALDRLLAEAAGGTRAVA